MGQQQLLLIVLGVIIVGIAVVVGMNVFSANSVQANRDALVADMMTIGNMAFQFYKKPAMLGGGGNKFTGFEIPKQLRGGSNGSKTKAVNANGEVVIAVQANKVELTGTGKEKGDDGSNVVKYTLNVEPEGLGNVTKGN